MERLTTDLWIKILLFLEYEDFPRATLISKYFLNIFRVDEYWVLRALRRLNMPDTPEFRRFFLSAKMYQDRELTEKLKVSSVPEGIKTNEEMTKFLLDVLSSNEDVLGKALSLSVKNGKNYITELVPEPNPVKKYLRALTYGQKVEFNSTIMLSDQIFLYYLMLEGKEELFRKVIKKTDKENSFIIRAFRHALRFNLNNFARIILEEAPENNVKGCVKHYSLIAGKELNPRHEDFVKVLMKRKALTPTIYYIYKRYEKEGNKILGKIPNEFFSYFTDGLKDLSELDNLTLSDEKIYQLVYSFALTRDRYVGPFESYVLTYGRLTGFTSENQLNSFFEHAPQLVKKAISISNDPIYNGEHTKYKYVWIAEALEQGKPVEIENLEISFLKSDPEMRKIILKLFPLPDPPEFEPEIKEPIYFNGTTWSLEPF